jgi:hypothetical protein
VDASRFFVLCPAFKNWRRLENTWSQHITPIGISAKNSRMFVALKRWPRDSLMECSLALQHASYMRTSQIDFVVRYRVVNKNGDVFLLCSGCLEHYQRHHSDWRTQIQVQRLYDRFVVSR